MKPAVLVTGATGFVGSAIVAHLHARGYGAVGLARSGAAGPSRRVARAWTVDQLTTQLEGIDVVVHAASVVHRPETPLSEYRRFNVEGTRALASAARARGVRQLVFLSSIKVHGEDPPGGRIDESTPVMADGGYASTKVDAEDLLREMERSGALRVAILRLCPVFGRGDKGNVRRVISAIARRRFFLPGDGSTRKSIVHVSTVARVVEAAIEKNASGVFLVADREAPTMRALADTVAELVGRRRPISVPAPALRAAAVPIELAARALGREPPVSRALIDKSLKSSVCVVDHVERALDVTCHVDLRDALSEEVAWLRESGHL